MRIRSFFLVCCLLCGLMGSSVCSAGAYDDFPRPSAAEIAAHDRTAAMRSPYLYGYLDISDDLRFTEFAADFCADTLPPKTYLCLANMRMDLSPLKKLYTNVHTEYEQVNMYAGFQRLADETVSILSFWDIYYTDASGHQQTLRAKRIYPDDYNGSDSFGGEGTGAHTIAPYDWEAGHWYRMLLQCGTSETGTTTVEQWVLDLETNAWTLLCKYDTGIVGSCFTGPVAFFLENFDPAVSGEVRSMQVKNVRLFDQKAGKWRGIRSAYIGSNGGVPSYEGSYAYDTRGDAFRLITSGVGGDWYGQKRFPRNKTLTVSHADSSCPY